MRLSKFIIILSLISIRTFSFGQEYIFPDEVVLYSFATPDGKMMTLNREKSDRYIVYRFGTKEKIEFEFPGKTNESWKKFKYSSYLRGGGVQNEGMDLNYVYFINEGFKYIIFDTYYSADDKREIGIKIINLKTKKTTVIRGDINTLQGTLTDFRDNHLLEKGEEIFD